MPPPYPPITVPQTPAQIEAAMADLAASFAAGGLCTLEAFPNQSVEGADIHYLKIANGTGAQRPVAVILGGVHARESAPPDALIRFAQNILVSCKTGRDITFPPLTCVPLPAGPGVRYPSFRIDASAVKRIIDDIDLYIAPLVNPDGRLFDQLNPPANPADGGWRKNRRPNAIEARVGVDLNRNHDVAWFYEDYYDMAVYLAEYAEPPASTILSDETYRGPLAVSEPETQNIQWIIDTKKPRFFLDVHQFGRKILQCWGIEDNGDDPAMTYSNPAWKGLRDGLRPGSANLPMGRTDYREYIPNDSPHYLQKNLRVVAESMRDAILASASSDPPLSAANAQRIHSRYDVGFSASLYHPVGGPVTGTTDDYAFKRQFDDPARAPVFALTMEAGHDEERGFHPDYATPPGHYAKIEREIHAALIAFCTAAAKYGKLCLIATAATGTPEHPDVVTLRRVRDERLAGTRVGALLDRAYYSFSPPVARYLADHPAARAAVRHGLVRPAAATLRALLREER